MSISFYWGQALGVYLLVAFIAFLLEKVFKMKPISIFGLRILSKEIGLFWLIGTIIVFLLPIFIR